MERLITSADIRNLLYFSSHLPSGGGLTLHTPDGKAWPLTIAAGEDLLDNLQVNAENARALAKVI